MFDAKFDSYAAESNRTFESPRTASRPVRAEGHAALLFVAVFAAAYLAMALGDVAWLAPSRSAAAGATQESSPPEWMGATAVLASYDGTD